MSIKTFSHNVKNEMHLKTELSEKVLHNKIIPRLHSGVRSFTTDMFN